MFLQGTRPAVGGSRGSLYASLCSIAGQRAFSSGAWIPWFGTFEKLGMHDTGQREVPLLLCSFAPAASCFPEIMQLLACILCHLSLHYAVVLKCTGTLSVACISVSLAVARVPACATQKLQRFPTEQLLFIQPPSHIFSLLILFSDPFSCVASAAASRSNLTEEGSSSLISTQFSDFELLLEVTGTACRALRTFSAAGLSFSSAYR